MEISRIDRSLRRYQAAGVLMIVIMFAGVGGWAAMAEISGAVVAPGVVTVEDHPKKVQHLEGGIVAAILVRNGDLIEAGAPLVRLDDTELRSSLEIALSQKNELRALKARLQAELDDLPEMRIPVDVDGAARLAFESQVRLHQSRREGRLLKATQLEQRIGQLSQAIVGLHAQETSKQRQLELIAQELKGVRSLKDQQLITTNRLLSLERELARLEGERGQHVADIARTEVQANETRVQLSDLKQSFLSDTLREHREADARLAETSERTVALAARLKRLDILAPRSGIVHKLAINTIGGVIAPGETIMEIVPQEEVLVIEGQIEPTSIDQVGIGQPVRVRLSAFDQRTTPELEGFIAFVAPDVRQDGPTLPRYYGVRVSLAASEIDRIGLARLVPGMPVELMIRRSSRSVLSYLVKPITDQLAKTFRED
jgi:HlyD family secretion protein